MSNWTTDAAAPVVGGPTGYGRYSAVADDGTIYVLNNASTMNIYNPVANSWSTVSPTGGSFSTIYGAVWINGVVYAVAYLNNSTSIWAYNPSTNAWTAKATLSGNQFYLQAAPVGSKIYVVSYDYSEFLNIYDTVSNTWSTGATPPESAQKFVLTASSTTVYMLCSKNSGNNPEKTAYSYNVSANTWHTLAAPSIYGSVATYGIGNVYYAGDGTTTVDVYDTSADTWSTSTATDLPAARADLMGGSAPRVMYMLCGQDGTGTAVSTVYAYPLNHPPNQDAWASPADGSTLNRAVDQVLNYTFSDPDVGDSQSARKWRYSTDGGTTWTETDETTTSTAITILANTFTSGATVQVQVVSADSTGTYPYDGSGNLLWSASLHLTFEDEPSPPTITSPTSGAVIGASSQVFDFSCPSLTKYQYRVVDNSNTTTVYIDWTTVNDASSRVFVVAGLHNGVTIQTQLQIYDNGLWSNVTAQANPVTFDPPPTPAVTLTPSATDGTITVTVTTAAPGAGQVAATAVTVEASPDGGTTVEWSRSDQAINGDVVFDTPASGVDYSFRATAFAASGTAAATGWTT